MLWIDIRVVGLLKEKANFILTNRFICNEDKADTLLGGKFHDESQKVCRKKRHYPIGLGGRIVEKNFEE